MTRRWREVAAMGLMSALPVGVALLVAGCNCAGGREADGPSSAEPPAQRAEAKPTTQPTPARSKLLTGEWKGRWSSDQGHGSGELVSTVRRGEDGTYLATFEAEYADGLYTHRTEDVVLTVTDAGGGRWEFAGKKDLGLLAGGEYTYTGWVEGDTFRSRYDSRFDTGSFRMERVE